MIILHILLILLKIIGILLLLILGLILLILLVPIRYYFEVDYQKGKKPHALVRVTWFVKLLHILAFYDEKGLHYRVKIAFKMLKTSEKPEENTEPEETFKEEDIPSDDEEESTEVPAAVKPPEEIPKPEDVREQAPADAKTVEEKPEKKETAEKKKEKPKKKTSGEEEKKPGPVDKAREKMEKVKALWEEYRVSTVAPFLMNLLMRVIKHVLPKQLNGHVDYGFDDPSLTGKVTALVAPFYPQYAKSFTVRPDFFEECLEADCNGKGRVRLGYLVWILILILLNKDTRYDIIRFLKR